MAVLALRARASGFPHSPQNLMPGAFSKPQPEHLSFSGAPHSPQNFIPLAFSKPQAGQRMDGPVGPASTVDPRPARFQATPAYATSWTTAADQRIERGGRHHLMLGKHGATSATI